MRRIVEATPVAKAATATLLASVAVLTTPTAPARADAGDGPGALPARVQALYARAADASAAHEAAKANATKQRTALAQLRAAQKRNSAQRARLNGLVGASARAQYRSGPLTTSAALLETQSLDALMYRLSLKRQGDHALDHLFAAVRRAAVHLERERGERERKLTTLRQTEERRAKLREGIERKLYRAERAIRQARGEADAKNPGRNGGGTGPAKCAYADAATHTSPEADGTWTLPTAHYWLSAPFGGSGARWANRHTGQDFAVSQGTPVYAAGAGRVARVGCGDGFGNQVVVAHPNGYYTQYAHLSEVHVREGQRLDTGEELGLSGQTGNAAGPHLHFEVRLTESMGSAIDPVPWLRQHGVSP